MRRMVFGMMVAALALTGCFQHTYSVGAGAPDAAVVYKHWHHHWLFGLIRPKLQKELDVENLCPSGDATIHEEVSFVNGLVDVLIGIVYSPTTVTIRCEDGSETEVDLTEDEVARIVTDSRFPALVEEFAPERLGEVRLAVDRSRAQPTIGTSSSRR